MWASVLFQGRPVPLPVPSISRMQRSPQDRHRLRPLARLIPPGSPHRSMSASTTRPVRHNVPSQLSIVARPHRMASCVPGELIPCAFVWRDPGITPCCKTLFALVIKILRALDATFALKSGDLSATDKLRATSVTVLRLHRPAFVGWVPSQFMRGAAISFDVGVFEEAARLLQTLLVGEDVAFVGMLLGGKFQRQRVELLAAVLEDVARR